MRTALIYLNIFFSIGTIASAFSPFINPSSFWMPAFLGLLFPYLLLVHVIFIFFWFLFKNKKPVFISLITLLVCSKSVLATFSISIPVSSDYQYSIMTWNVKNFDLYNWSENENSRQEMFDLIKEKSPDILCLQEFYNEKNGAFNNIQSIKNDLGYDYYYFRQTYCLDNGERCWGLITFSKSPIKEYGVVEFEQTSKLNACLFTDIELGDTVVRVYNVHLQSIHFGQEDYAYISSGEPNIESSKKIVAKLKMGFVNRASQAERIVLHRQSTNKCAIICGDFNDTPISFAYRFLSENMQDAFIEKGFGFGETYISKIPLMRIDYVLMDRGFQVYDYNIYKEKANSDHYPSETFFTLPQKQE